MKQSILSLLILSLVLPQTVLGVKVVEGSFSDIQQNHENYEAINYVKNNNIVSGYEDGTFQAEKTINRAEFTKIMVQAKFTEEEIQNCNLLTLNFSDVASSSWFAPYVCKAKEENIIGGYEDKTFRPSQNVTFAEASKIATNIFSEEDITENSEIWYAPFVGYLSEKASIPTTIEDLGSEIKRGEVAEIFYRLKEDITEKPSLKFTNNKLENLNKVDSQEIPPSCQHWYDGCNECYRSDIGEPLKCTKKACQFEGTEGCRFFFQAPVKILSLPTLNCKVWTDGTNTCSRANLGDAPSCTDEVKEINIDTQKITCTQEFEEEIISEVSMKENPIYTFVSPANLKDNLGKKAIVFYFHSFENCVFCRGTDKDLAQNLDSFPKNTLILKVQFDTDQYKELKEKFKVTEPNTIVVINKNKSVIYQKTDFSIEELTSALKQALK